MSPRDVVIEAWAHRPLPYGSPDDALPPRRSRPTAAEPARGNVPRPKRPANPGPSNPRG